MGREAAGMHENPSIGEGSLFTKVPGRINKPVPVLIRKPTNTAEWFAQQVIPPGIKFKPIGKGSER